MELTFPRGALDETTRADIAAFYGEMFGWRGVDVELFDQKNFLLAGEDGAQSFILLAEADKHMQAPGYDHLGILCDTREEVDDLLELAKKWRDKDDRVKHPRVPEGSRHGSGHGARVLRALPAADPVRRAVHRVRRGQRARRSVGRTPERRGAPKHLVVVLLDSLNRHFLDCYLDATEQRARRRATGVGDWADIEPVATPNLDRSRRVIALRQALSGRCRACRRATTCWSARSTSCGGRGARSRSGRTRSPTTCARAGVTTMLVSDHPHLFETGGENYHTDFTAWDYVRGHEERSVAHAPRPVVDRHARARRPSAALRAPRLRRLAHVVPRRGDFPGRDDAGGRGVAASEQAPSSRRPVPAVRRRVRSARAVRHARAVGGAVRPGLGRRRGSIWPPYAVDDDREGPAPTEREARQIRANYGAKLSMIDHWLGRIARRARRPRRCGTTPRSSSAPTTATTSASDGRRRASRGVPLYEPTRPHHRCSIAWPGVAPGTVDALTTTVDLHATLADVFGVEPTHRTHGRSLVPAARRRAATSIREWALLGRVGPRGARHRRDTARTRALRSATTSRCRCGRTGGRRCRCTPVPELRLPSPTGAPARLHAGLGRAGDPPAVRPRATSLPFWADGVLTDQHLLHDVDNDPGETRNLAGTAAEKEAVDLLRAALDEIEAPDRAVRTPRPALTSSDKSAWVLRGGAGGRRRTRARGSPRPRRPRTTTSSTVAAGDRFEHLQVRRLGFVPAGEQPVDGVDAPRSGVITTSVQPSPACTTRRSRRRPSRARARPSCRSRSRGRRRRGSR